MDAIEGRVGSAVSGGTTPEQQARDLAVARRRATGLLVLVTVAFVVVAVTTEDAGGWAYARAALEAGMVGGLADWFAVVALFRHPLGLPIPHTAVIPTRKDRFGDTLGRFVQESFLNADVVGARVADAHVARRAVDWVLAPGNAEKVAAHTAEAVVRVLEAIRDEDVQAAVERQLRLRVDDLDVAGFLSRTLEVLTGEGRHRELVDAILRGLERFIEENEATLRDRYAQESPWWLPTAVDDVLFDRLLNGVKAVLRGPTGGGTDEVREQLDTWIAQAVVRLEHDPAWRTRIDELKRDALAHPQLRAWIGAVWDGLKAGLRNQARVDTSALRRELTAAIRAAARRFSDDDEAVAGADATAVRVARNLVDAFGGEIEGLVASTIKRWDGQETATRLELLLGRDLQFIRINGTVVGALAGVAIHALGTLLSR